MAFKKILTLGIFFGDLFLIIWLLGLIGIRQSAVFMGSYMLFMFIWAIVLLLLFPNLSNEMLWEDEFNRRAVTRKKGYWRLFLLIGIITTSLLSVLYIPAWIAGIISSFAVVTFWLTSCRDILYTISAYMLQLEDIICETKTFKKITERLLK